MKYQILEQHVPGEPWHFIAHGARYDGPEKDKAITDAKRLGVRRKAIACGKPPRIYASRVKLDSGGYSPGGAYYGVGAPVFACEANGYESAHVRAIDRATAIAEYDRDKVRESKR